MRVIVPLLLLFLLLSAAPLHAEACPAAPPPRFLPGMEGVVAPGIRGLNLRALPAVGAGTLLTLNSGTRFRVISGPSCNSDYNWWRVTVIGSGGVSGWLAEGAWEQDFVLPGAGDSIHRCAQDATPFARVFLAPLCAFIPPATPE